MKQKRVLIIFLVAVFVLGLFPVTAFAASASVSAPSTAYVGSTFSVKVKFSASNIGAVQGSFSYNKSILKYVSGSGTSDGKIVLYTSSEGASSLSTTIKFKALKTGKSSISVSAGEILAFDESSLGSAKGSDSITVKDKSEKPSPQPSTSKSSEPSPSPSVNPVDQAIQVTIDGQILFLWTTLAGVTLPQDFKVIDLTYQNQKIQTAAANKLKLAYLTDQKGENGSFYILDKETLYPYIPVDVKKSFTIINPESTLVIPNGFMETIKNLQDSTVQAWESDKVPGFYLLYVMNSECKKGFYTYDPIEGTLQRYTDRTVVVEVEKAPVVLQPKEESLETVQKLGFFEKLHTDTTMQFVFVVLTVLTVVMLVVIILLLVKKGKDGRHLRLKEKENDSKTVL